MIKILQKTKDKSNSVVSKSQVDTSKFHNAMRYSLKLTQFFSFFPINVDTTTDFNVLKFRWMYWRIAYSAITFALFIFEFVLVVYQTISTELTLLSVTIFAFHLGGVIQYILFLKLSMQWYNFVLEWHSLELRMRNYEVIGNLQRKLKFLTTIIMTIAGIEHALVNAYKIARWLSKEKTTYDAFQRFFTTTYAYVFDVCQYSTWLGVVLQFTNLQRTFNWSFADVFVMLIGSAFTYRLKQLIKKIENSSQIKNEYPSQWITIRRDYNKLAEMCHIINKRISSIIIVCYLTNLFFVLVQLFKSLRTIPDIVEKIYFYLSFLLLILRIVCLCILGGSVYEEWENIAFELNSVSSFGYNEEVERLLRHVITWELTLSGKNFFNVTRKLILKIAGAIVTYELVLIQFYYNSMQNSDQ